MSNATSSTTTTATTASEALSLKPLGHAADGELETVELSGGGPLLIGRAHACDLVLVDPTISRRHASLIERDGRWFVIDMGGRQGTYLNGIRLEPEVPTRVAAGDYLRVGPYPFRFEHGSLDESLLTQTQKEERPGTIVQRVEGARISSVAQRLLDLLIDGAAALHNAGDEQALAEAIIDLVLAATSFPRAAVLRAVGTEQFVEIVGCRDLSDAQDRVFTFSQSLIREAANGHPARLSQQQTLTPGNSIERLGITAALCVPIVLDDVAMGFIYLDARENEQVDDGDVVGFCQALGTVAGLALANLKRAELLRRQLRLEEDLKGARTAQAFLSPRQEGIVGEIRYATKTQPGRVVAGDLFDIFPLDDGRVGICFGDVSGQGMPAAIHMTAVLSSMRFALKRTPDPAVAARAVNRFITERSPEHVFVSLWVGVYDPREAIIDYVDAGHGHWCTLSPDAPPHASPRPGGLLIGIDADHPYSAERLELPVGHRLVLYSDGVCERKGPEGNLYGATRAYAALARSTSVGEDVTRLFADSEAYAAHAPIDDDTTVASIERMAKPE